MNTTEIQSQILSLVSERGVNRTICPSEAARAIDPENWKELMDAVRQAGLQLEESGKIDVMQKGEKVDGCAARGPIRYRLRCKD